MHVGNQKAKESRIVAANKIVTAEQTKDWQHITTTNNTTTQQHNCCDLVSQKKKRTNTPKTSHHIIVQQQATIMAEGVVANNFRFLRP